MRTYWEILSTRRLKKRPRMQCRYCGGHAVVDVTDYFSGVLYGFMCEKCKRNFFNLGRVPVSGQIT